MHRFRFVRQTLVLLSNLLTVYACVILFLFLPPVLTFTHQSVLSAFPSSFNQQELHEHLSTASKIVIWGKSSPQGSSFTPAEVSHLQDVHQVLFSIFLLAVPAAFLTFFLREFLSARLLILCGLFLFVLTGVVALTFPVFFETFHQIFFPQGNFAFPADSALIQTFPLEFWTVEFVLLQGGVIAGLVGEAQLIK